MIWKGWISALGLLVLVATWVGCETPGAVKPYICAADDIRAGDTLMISILDVPEAQRITDREVMVGGDGTINVPNLQSVQAAGKTFGQFQRELQTNYITAKIFRQPTVIVKPGLRFYSVGGEVKQPGRQAYSGQTTVLRAIVTAGDFTEFAKRTKVEIVRADGQYEIMDCNKARKNPKFDRPICPGDSITVPRSL
jgi:protein involved in polysaccharide export with SLBB domain